MGSSQPAPPGSAGCRPSASSPARDAPSGQDRNAHNCRLSGGTDGCRPQGRGAPKDTPNALTRRPACRYPARPDPPERPSAPIG